VHQRSLNSLKELRIVHSRQINILEQILIAKAFNFGRIALDIFCLTLCAKACDWEISGSKNMRPRLTPAGVAILNAVRAQTAASRQHLIQACRLPSLPYASRCPMIAHRFLAEILSWLSIVRMGRAIVIWGFSAREAFQNSPLSRCEAMGEGERERSLRNLSAIALPARGKMDCRDSNGGWSVRCERILCERIEDLKPFTIPTAFSSAT
jgi:hypothetical protein